MALKVRKGIMSAIYDKVGSLSMRSLAETNSGKLITMISSDLYSIERGLLQTPVFFCVPWIAAVCIYLIWNLSQSWESTLIVAVMWILCVIMSFCNAKFAKKHK